MTIEAFVFLGFAAALLLGVALYAKYQHKKRK